MANELTALGTMSAEAITSKLASIAGNSLAEYTRSKRENRKFLAKLDKAYMEESLRIIRRRVRASGCAKITMDMIDQMASVYARIDKSDVDSPLYAFQMQAFQECALALMENLREYERDI